MNLSFIRIFKYLAIIFTVCYLLLLNPQDLSLANNLPVYIGLTSSALLLASMFITERVIKKKQKK